MLHKLFSVEMYKSLRVSFSSMRTSYTSLRNLSGKNITDHGKRRLDPKYDMAFKKIFCDVANKQITQRFLTDITNLKFVDLTFEDPWEMDTSAEEKDIVYVKCTSSTGEKYLIVNQNYYQRYHVQRALYYGCRAYTEQVEPGDIVNWDELKNVTVISISNTPLFMKNASYISKHQILDTETFTCELDGLTFYFIDLTKFKLTKIDQLKTCTDVWCYYLKYIHELDEPTVSALEKQHPFIASAVEELEEHSLIDEEYDRYLRYCSANMHLVEDLEKFVEKNVAKNIAQKMLYYGFPIEEILTFTGLRKEDLK